MKTPVEVAKEVISGEWGNGEERRNRLQGAGYDPNVIQSLVNDMMRTGKDVVEITVDRSKVSGILIKVEG